MIILGCAQIFIRKIKRKCFFRLFYSKSITISPNYCSIKSQKINEKTFIFCEWNFLHAQIWSNFASMFATKNKWKFPSFAKLAQTSFIARVGKFRNECLSGLNFTRAVFDLSHNKLKLKKVQIFEESYFWTKLFLKKSYFSITL